MLVHATNIVLVFQCYLASKYYERYMDVKNKVDAIKKAESDPKSK